MTTIFQSKNSATQKRIRHGQTFPEMMIVVAIIAILAAVIIANLFHARAQAQVSSVMGTEKQISNALESYFADYGTYPSGRLIVGNSLFATPNPYYNGLPNGNGVQGPGNRDFHYIYDDTSSCGPAGCNYDIDDSCIFDGGDFPSSITDLSGNPGVPGSTYQIIYSNPKGFFISGPIGGGGGCGG